MAGYLEEYGVADERRSRVMRRIVIAGGVAIAGVIVYLALPMLSMLVPPLSPGWWHVRSFMSDLRRTTTRPPIGRGLHAAVLGLYLSRFHGGLGPAGTVCGRGVRVHPKVRPCGDGTVVVIDWKGDNQTLWYRPVDKSLTFWPWGGCPAHFAAAGPERGTLMSAPYGRGSVQADCGLKPTAAR